jgi:pyrroloquinoline quinone biosynthesis protein D
MLGETTILSLTPAATFQPLGESEGAVVLLTDSGQLYTCNDTTVALLQALDGVRSFGSIVDELLDEFDVERDVLAADLSKLVGELEREGIIAVAMGSA